MPSNDLPQKSTSTWGNAMATSAVFLWGGILFLPCVTYEFVSWDDGANFLENTGYRGLGPSQLWWMATSFHHGHYHPLTWLTIAIDYSIWGLDKSGQPNPTGMHFTNVLLHAINCVLVYWVTRYVLELWRTRENRPSSEAANLGDRFAAVVATMFWGGHPLRAESVAWATERRDVLSTAFLLGSMLCYLHFQNKQRLHHRWSILAWFLFALSLLSRAGGIVWPVILLIVDVALLHRIEWKWQSCWRDRSFWQLVFEKLPYVLLALVFAWIAARAQQTAGAWQALTDHGWSDRILQAASGVGWYVIQTVWPMSLSPLYPLPDGHLGLFNPGVVAGILASVSVTLVTFCLRRRFEGPWIAWCCFLVLVAPVSGLAQSGMQWFADRYTYLSTIPWFVLAAGLLRTVHQFVRAQQANSDLPFSAVFSGVLGSIMAISGWLTLEQMSIWRDSLTLWKHATSVTEYNPLARNNLAFQLMEREKFDEALTLIDQALAEDPNYAAAWNNRGNLHLQLNLPADALADFSRALELKPNEVRYWNNQGSAFAELGRFDAAQKSFERAIEISPKFAEAYRNRFLAWVHLRNPDKALADLETYTRLVGSLTPTEQEEARLLLQQAATPADASP